MIFGVGKNSAIINVHVEATAGPIIIDESEERGSIDS